MDAIDGILGGATTLGWALAYAVPWAGAFLVGRWAWSRVSPRSAFLAWTAATCVALGVLLVLSVLLVSVIEVVAVPPA